MSSRIASSCPPMKLRERDLLDAKQLRFIIPPLPSIFVASATQVLTKALLRTFINDLLSTLHCDSSLTTIPATGRWGLQGDTDDLVDLNSWNPRQTNQHVYKVIPLPVVRGPGTSGGESSSQKSSVGTIELPSQGVFEVQGSHLLVVIHYRLKVKISKKKKIEKSQITVFIPADLKVVDLVKVVKLNSNVTGLYEILGTENLQTDARTVTQLGWKHGTELRLEMF